MPEGFRIRRASKKVTMKAIEPQPMVSTRAAAEIRTAILNGSLLPGSRVRQEELAAKLGVSREPIRKALLVLEREGLVNNVLNRGAIVAPIDLPLINDIYEFRETVEAYVAGKVAALPDFDVDELQKIVAQGRKAVRSGALDKLIDADLAFHTALYEASGNKVVLEVMQTQWGHIRRAMLTVLNSVGHRKQVWDEHEALLDAIANRDVAKAKSLAAAHIHGAESWLTAGLQNSTKERESS